MTQASFLIIMAATGIWLTACGGAAGPSPATGPASTSYPYSSTQDASVQAGSPGARQVNDESAQGKGAVTSAGEESKGGSPPAAATNSAIRPKVLTVRDAGQGGITVKATWVVAGSPEAASAQIDRYLAFKMAIDTHSGDLGGYNLARLSVLRGDKGGEVPAAAWESISEGSHHREGVLKFPRGAEQGARYMEVLVREVGGVKERVLRWDLEG